MNNVEIFIICHDRPSYEWFVKNNRDVPNFDKFRYVLVGDHTVLPDYMPKNTIVCNLLKNNIEKHKTLLTYTAWYALLINCKINSKYVGLFEYDIVIKNDLFQLANQLDYKTFGGFFPYSTKSPLYLDSIPQFCELIPERQLNRAKNEYEFWNATTNCILPIAFLDMFTVWYKQFVPKILSIKNHPHIHERAVNLYASTNAMKYKFFDGYMIHKQFKSHKIELS